MCIWFCNKVSYLIDACAGTVQARLKGASDLDSAGVQFPSLPPTGEHLLGLISRILFFLSVEQLSFILFFHVIELWVPRVKIKYSWSLKCSNRCPSRYINPNAKCYIFICVGTRINIYVFSSMQFATVFLACHRLKIRWL